MTTKLIPPQDEKLDLWKGIISGSVGTLILCQVIQLVEGQLWYNTCGWCDYWLPFFGLSPDDNCEDLESGICVVKASVPIIVWCTNVALQSFHLLTFLLKNSHNDGAMVMNADLN